MLFSEHAIPLVRLASHTVPRSANQIWVKSVEFGECQTLAFLALV